MCLVEADPNPWSFRKHSPLKPPWLEDDPFLMGCNFSGAIYNSDFLRIVMVQWNMGVSPKVVPFQKIPPFSTEAWLWETEQVKFDHFFVEDFVWELICTFQETLTYPTCGKGNIFKHALVTGYVRSDQGIVKRLVKWFSKRKSKDFEGSHFLMIGTVDGRNPAPVGR